MYQSLANLIRWSDQVMLEGVNSEDKEMVTTVKGVIKAVLDGVKVGHGAAGGLPAGRLSHGSLFPGFTRESEHFQAPLLLPRCSVWGHCSPGQMALRAPRPARLGGGKSCQARGQPVLSVFPVLSESACHSPGGACLPVDRAPGILSLC